MFLDTENAITGSGNDILFAAYTNNRADNEFTGNGGNDLEIAGAGNDTFHEGAAANGADDMDGGTGWRHLRLRGPFERAERVAGWCRQRR